MEVGVTAMGEFDLLQIERLLREKEVALWWNDPPDTGLLRESFGCDLAVGAADSRNRGMGRGVLHLLTERLFMPPESCACSLIRTLKTREQFESLVLRGLPHLVSIQGMMVTRCSTRP
jgi:hypothetical protein